MGGADSYSVLRGPFDQWLASKAEEAGAEYICGIAVEELLKDGSGRVTGIRAGEDEITSQVVILCEGCNTILSERCLGNPRPKPSQMAVGIKEVFELPANVIEDRFLVPEGEGAAMLFVGDCTHGNVGGGFLYTNKTSISLGFVATISKAESVDNQVPSTRCSRTSGTTPPSPPSSAAPRWSSTPATWCPRAATT